MNTGDRAAREAGALVTVDELVARLRPGLIPVPRGGGAVCPRCRSTKGEDFAVCYPCSRGAAELGGFSVNVIPIAMALAYGQLHDHLKNYKRAYADCVRYRSATILGGLLVTYLKSHHSCVGEWDIVCSVPSIKHPMDHPLALLLDRVHGLREHHLRVLAPGVEPGSHVYSRSRFTVHDRSRIEGQRVLLIDDTFTTGASIQSAAAALMDAGAASVVALVIGRYIDPSKWAPAKDLLDLLDGQPWDGSCPVCAPADAGEPDLFTF